MVRDSGLVLVWMGARGVLIRFVQLPKSNQITNNNIQSLPPKSKSNHHHQNSIAKSNRPNSTNQSTNQPNHISIHYLDTKSLNLINIHINRTIIQPTNKQTNQYQPTTNKPISTFTTPVVQIPTPKIYIFHSICQSYPIYPHIHSIMSPRYRLIPV